MATWDVAVIGGGIVGQATAWSLLQSSEAAVIVLEAEDTLAAHQSGRNSNVIHSGLYYKPGSLKATLCARGREMMYAFCAEHDIPCERCGKIVLAHDDVELNRLDMLEQRGMANGLTGLHRMSIEETRERESHVVGAGALLVPETGITDFAIVTQTLATLIEECGGRIETSARVTTVRCMDNMHIIGCSSGSELRARHIISCAGAQSDRIALLCGAAPNCRIVPFRGEYFNLRPERTSLVRHLIYPVPNPALPFLGVHFTRMVRGGVEAGPNAVFSFSRSRYRKLDVNIKDLLDCLSFRGFWRMAARHWKTAIDEQARSISRMRFARSLQRLIPEVDKEDLTPGHCGIRAQAIDPDGSLVDDFRFVEAERQLHVLNAPSPAATASLAIGAYIADRAMQSFDLAASRR